MKIVRPLLRAFSGEVDSDSPKKTRP